MSARARAGGSRNPETKSGAAPRSVVVLAGGVGAARFLRGVVQCVAPESLTVIVNTGDDRVFYGVHVSPDLDIVTYTLAGRIDPERGYGLAGDRFGLIERLRALGHETWFRLGDADFANGLHRTLRLAAGARLDEITDELRRDHGLGFRILEAREFMWSDKIIAGMITIGLLGLFIDTAVSRLNNHLLRWHRGLEH